MFVTPEAPGEGISAVKALSKAAQQGQRIYHITQANAATALPNIHIDAAAKSEITAALNAGKEVTTHTDPISVPGWSGAGYILKHPLIYAPENTAASAACSRTALLKPTISSCRSPSRMLGSRS